MRAVFSRLTHRPRLADDSQSKTRRVHKNGPGKVFNPVPLFLDEHDPVPHVRSAVFGIMGGVASPPARPDLHSSTGTSRESVPSRPPRPPQLQLGTPWASWLREAPLVPSGVWEQALVDQRYYGETPGRIRACKREWTTRRARAAELLAWLPREPSWAPKGHRDAEIRQTARDRALGSQIRNPKSEARNKSQAPSRE